MNNFKWQTVVSIFFSVQLSAILPSSTNAQSRCSFKLNGQSVDWVVHDECSFHEGQKEKCSYLLWRGSDDKIRKGTLFFKSSSQPSDYCIALRTFEFQNNAPFEGREILTSPDGDFKGYLKCQKKKVSKTDGQAAYEVSVVIAHSKKSPIECAVNAL